MPPNASPEDYERTMGQEQRHDDEHGAPPEPEQLAFDDRESAVHASGLVPNGNTSRCPAADGVLQRVAQIAAGEVDEDVVERRALDRQ